MKTERTIDATAVLMENWIIYILRLLLRALAIMFVAAVVAKRTTVFAAVGYPESVAWSVGYGLVKGLWRDEA